MQRGWAKKRGSTWTAYWKVGDAVGGYRQRTKGGFATKRAAQAYLNQVLAGLQKGEMVEPNRMSLSTYLRTRWLPTVKHQLRASTWDSYSRVVEQHVIPVVGHIRLQDLTADQLDRLYAQLLEHGRRDGRGGLAPKTVRYIHGVIHKALKDAERKQLVMRNVAQAADPPKLRQAGREMKTWSAGILRRFLEGVSQHRLYAAFLLAATTGMRRGEVLGLRWSDIDFGAGRLAVRQTVLSVNYRITFGTPKTARGRRSIALDAVTLSALQAQRSRQQAEKALVGRGYADHDLVFATPEGRPVHPDYFTQCFDRQVARLRLPRIRLHDLRHTHATLGLAAGVPAKVMADRLGHATVAFTQDIYMHAIPQLEDAAASRMADLIFDRSAEALPSGAAPPTQES